MTKIVTKKLSFSVGKSKKFKGLAQGNTAVKIGRPENT